VSKLLRNGSSGLEEEEEEEEEKEKKKKREMNFFVTLCRQLNIDEKKSIC
jgi:hypothetical protein